MHFLPGIEFPSKNPQNTTHAQYYIKHVFACGLVTVPQIQTSASDSLGWGGVGWGGMITSLAFPHDLDATLYDLHWHFHMILMLRSMIFIGNST